LEKTRLRQDSNLRHQIARFDWLVEQASTVRSTAPQGASVRTIILPGVPFSTGIPEHWKKPG